MSIRIFNGTEGAGAGSGPPPNQANGQRAPHAIDEAQLAAEVLAGETVWGNVPLSQAHLFALAASAQQTIARRDFPVHLRTYLEDFLVWCTRHAHFGPQTRALLAWQQGDLREHPPV